MPRLNGNISIATAAALYADEADHELWHSDDPSFVFPPHEDP